MKKLFNKIKAFFCELIGKYHVIMMMGCKIAGENIRSKYGSPSDYIYEKYQEASDAHKKKAYIWAGKYLSALN